MSGCIFGKFPIKPNDPSIIDINMGKKQNDSAFDLSCITAYLLIRQAASFSFITLMLLLV